MLDHLIVGTSSRMMKNPKLHIYLELMFLMSKKGRTISLDAIRMEESNKLWKILKSLDSILQDTRISDGKHLETLLLKFSNKNPKKNMKLL